MTLASVAKHYVGCCRNRTEENNIEDFPIYKYYYRDVNKENIALSMLNTFFIVIQQEEKYKTFNFKVFQNNKIEKLTMKNV